MKNYQYPAYIKRCNPNEDGLFKVILSIPVSSLSSGQHGSTSDMVISRVGDEETAKIICDALGKAKAETIRNTPVVGNIRQGEYRLSVINYKGEKISNAPLYIYRFDEDGNDTGTANITLQDAIYGLYDAVTELFPCNNRSGELSASDDSRRFEIMRHYESGIFDQIKTGQTQGWVTGPAGFFSWGINRENSTK